MHRSLQSVANLTIRPAKYSQTGFLKGRLGTSTMDSPQTPYLTPRIMTTCQIVTSKTNPLAPGKMRKGLKLVLVQKGSPKRMRPIPHKLPQPRLPKALHNYHNARLRPSTTTSQLQIPLNYTIFLADLCHSPGSDFVRTGKVAVIQDMAAVTYANLTWIVFIPYVIDLP